MATFLKLLLFGCICLSACTQQNKGVRSADELFKELESAYQHRDSVAFEKFFKEWNEISKDSLQMRKHSDVAVQTVYDIIEDLYKPRTLIEIRPDEKGKVLKKNDLEANYGIVQTSIGYCIQDSLTNCEKEVTIDRFYPKTRKSIDSIVYNFPQYAEALARFTELPNNKFYNRWESIEQWIYITYRPKINHRKIIDISLTKDFKTAKIRVSTSHLIGESFLKKINNKWVEADRNN